MEHGRRRTVALVLAAVSVTATLLLASGRPDGWAEGHSRPLEITVRDVTTGQPVESGDTITAGDQFQVTVTVADQVNCAGQYVVTALGAPGGPPSVLVQFQLFILGSAVGSNSVTGGVLTSNGTPGHPNDWKVSASCNGAKREAFHFTKFEFLSAVPE